MHWNDLLNIELRNKGNADVEALLEEVRYMEGALAAADDELRDELAAQEDRHREEINVLEAAHEAEQRAWRKEVARLEEAAAGQCAACPFRGAGHD